MTAEAAQEWLEPLDWIETDALTSEVSVEEISDLGGATWTRLLARLRTLTGESG